MTLATENIALKAENARLREALTQIIEADFSPECEICQLGGYFHPHSAEAEKFIAFLLYEVCKHEDEDTQQWK